MEEVGVDCYMLSACFPFMYCCGLEQPDWKCDDRPSFCPMACDTIRAHCSPYYDCFTVPPPPPPPGQHFPLWLGTDGVETPYETIAATFGGKLVDLRASTCRPGQAWYTTKVGADGNVDDISTVSIYNYEAKCEQSIDLRVADDPRLTHGRDATLRVLNVDESCAPMCPIAAAYAEETGEHLSVSCFSDDVDDLIEARATCKAYPAIEGYYFLGAPAQTFNWAQNEDSFRKAFSAGLFGPIDAGIARSGSEISDAHQAAGLTIVDLLEDLTPYLANSDFPLEDVFPSVADNLLYDGSSIIGLPMKMNTQGLFLFRPEKLPGLPTGPVTYAQAWHVPTISRDLESEHVAHKPAAPRARCFTRL